MESEVDPLELVTGGREPPDVDAETQIWVLW